MDEVLSTKAQLQKSIDALQNLRSTFDKMTLNTFEEVCIELDVVGQMAAIIGSIRPSHWYFNNAGMTACRRDAYIRGAKEWCAQVRRLEATVKEAIRVKCDLVTITGYLKSACVLREPGCTLWNKYSPPTTSGVAIYKGPDEVQCITDAAMETLDRLIIDMQKYQFTLV